MLTLEHLERIRRNADHNSRSMDDLTEDEQDESYICHQSDNEDEADSCNYSYGGRVAPQKSSATTLQKNLELKELNGKSD